MSGIPLYVYRVRAGFPSPAEDYIDEHIDFNALLIENPPSTFAVRAEGQSMKDAGILDGSILIIDRSKEPRHGDIGVFIIDGEMTVKYLSSRTGQVQLLSANPRYPPITVRGPMQAMGKVMWILSKPPRL